MARFAVRPFHPLLEVPMFRSLMLAFFSTVLCLPTCSPEGQDAHLLRMTLERDAADTSTLEEDKSCPRTLQRLPKALGARERVIPRIVIFKHAERVGLYTARGSLELRDDGSPACFDAALGPSPRGDKTKKDFASTPEGWYSVGSRHTSDDSDEFADSRYEHALFVNYPNADDVQRALDAEIIDNRTAVRLRRHIARGYIPDQGTPMGGSIMIHSWGDGTGTTWGCIGLKDADMIWLFAHTRKGDGILSIPWKWYMEPDGTFYIDPVSQL
jgi:murein L,D-transpeptidase YafK